MDDGGVKERLRRAQLNERAFQDHNARRVAIESSGDAEEPVPLICECEDPDCFCPILITVSEYARAVEPPDRFVVSPGHEDPTVETVVEVTQRYLVVQKPEV